MSTSNVLHLDPNEATRSLVAATHLRESPSSALVQVTDAKAARELIDDDSTFDLALVALNIEGQGDGLEFVRWLRREHPLGPPVYVLHDTLEPCFVADAMSAGAEGMLPTGDPTSLSAALVDLFGLHLSG